MRTAWIAGAVVVAAGFAAAVIAYRGTGMRSAPSPVPVATPAGVTLQRVYVGPMVAGGISNYKVPTARTVFADTQGRPAYMFDKGTEAGKSSCSDDCARSWLPVAASADAKGADGWTVIVRTDGSRQWALKGKPLYISAKDKPFGQPTANGSDEAWHVALFAPDEALEKPDGIAAHELPKANGIGLVDERDMTLYVFDGADLSQRQLCENADCAYRWKPVAAAAVARPIGEFSVVAGPGGSPQWAFRGQPLFSFDGDNEPGETMGEQPDKHWRSALVVRYFQPDGISIRRNHFGGVNLATKSGQTIYVRDRSSYMQGHSLRRGIPLVPAAGRAIGLSSCDAACAKTWPPVKAPSDAQPDGFWDVATRDDGSKQWVYMGYPLFLYSGDKEPGDMNGYDIYEFMPGQDPLKTANLPPMMPHGSAALVWRQASP